MLFKMVAIESAWAQYGCDVGMRPRQLFVTRSQNLANKVRESFASLHRTHVLDSAIATSAAINGLDSTHQSGWTEEMPSSFSDLRDAHFPLFIAFDSVSGTLEQNAMYPVLT